MYSKVQGVVVKKQFSIFKTMDLVNKSSYNFQEYLKVSLKNTNLGLSR